MDTRLVNLDKFKKYQELCRICLKNGKDCVAIFGQTDLPYNILYTLGMLVTEDDPFSKLICPSCLEMIDIIIQYQRKCLHRFQKLLILYESIQQHSRVNITVFNETKFIQIRRKYYQDILTDFSECIESGSDKVVEILETPGKPAVECDSFSDFSTPSPIKNRRCKECRKIFSQMSFDNHNCKRRICDYCKRQLPSSKTLSMHLAADHLRVTIPSIKTEDYKCNTCLKYFTSPEISKRHLVKCANKRADRIKYKPPKYEEYYNIRMDDKILPKRISNLNSSLASNYNLVKEPVCCKYCNEWCESDNSLWAHMLAKHSETSETYSVSWKLTCPQCNSLFYKKAKLQEHMLQKHLVCKFCSKRLSSNIPEYFSHVKTCKKNEEGVVACLYCGENFVNSAEYPAHIASCRNLFCKTDTRVDSFVTRCDVCEEKLLICDLESHLQDHLLFSSSTFDTNDYYRKKKWTKKLSDLNFSHESNGDLVPEKFLSFSKRREQQKDDIVLDQNSRPSTLTNDNTMVVEVNATPEDCIEVSEGDEIRSAEHVGANITECKKDKLPLTESDKSTVHAAKVEKSCSVTDTRNDISNDRELEILETSEARSENTSRNVDCVENSRGISLSLNPSISANNFRSSDETNSVLGADKPKTRITNPTQTVNRAPKQILPNDKQTVTKNVSDGSKIASISANESINTCHYDASDSVLDEMITKAIDSSIKYSLTEGNSSNSSNTLNNVNSVLDSMISNAIKKSIKRTRSKKNSNNSRLLNSMKIISHPATSTCSANVENLDANNIDGKRKRKLPREEKYALRKKPKLTNSTHGIFTNGLSTIERDLALPTNNDTVTALDKLQSVEDGFVTDHRTSEIEQIANETTDLERSKCGNELNDIQFVPLDQNDNAICKNDTDGNVEANYPTTETISIGAHDSDMISHFVCNQTKTTEVENRHTATIERTPEASFDTIMTNVIKHSTVTDEDGNLTSSVLANSVPNCNNENDKSENMSENNASTYSITDVNIGNKNTGNVGDSMELSQLETNNSSQDELPCSADKVAEDTNEKITRNKTDDKNEKDPVPAVIVTRELRSNSSKSATNDKESKKSRDNEIMENKSKNSSSVSSHSSQSLHKLSSCKRCDVEIVGCRQFCVRCFKGKSQNRNSYPEDRSTAGIRYKCRSCDRSVNISGGLCIYCNTSSRQHPQRSKQFSQTSPPNRFKFNSNDNRHTPPRSDFRNRQNPPYPYSNHRDNRPLSKSPAESRFFRKSPRDNRPFNESPGSAFNHSRPEPYDSTTFSCFKCLLPFSSRSELNHHRRMTYH